MATFGEFGTYKVDPWKSKAPTWIREIAGSSLTQGGVVVMVVKGRDLDFGFFSFKKTKRSMENFTLEQFVHESRFNIFLALRVIILLI